MLATLALPPSSLHLPATCLPHLNLLEGHGDGKEGGVVVLGGLHPLLIVPVPAVLSCAVPAELWAPLGRAQECGRGHLFTLLSLEKRPSD